MTTPRDIAAQRRAFALAVLGASAWAAAPATALAQSATVTGTTVNYGDNVVNVASLTYTQSGQTASIATNEAVFVIDRPDTPATIEFFRYAPGAADAVPTTINGSDFSPSGGTDGPFTAMDAPNALGGTPIALGAPVPLLPATTYLTGEVMFVQVTDEAANSDRDAVDTVVITVTSNSGDVITLRLYETGPDTGVFAAYIPSTTADSPKHDGELATPGNTELTATYASLFATTDVVVDTALVNPYNCVFSSASGEPVSGAVVTLLNLDTGERAAVSGVDGLGVYPGEVVSGDDVTDSAGLFYDNEPGEFRFPFLQPGRYVIEVVPPEGFTFASVATPEQISAVSGGHAYTVTPGSYGQAFTLDAPGPLRFDVPLDPVSEIVVDKRVDRASGDVGDYVNYTVTITNTGAATTRAELFDTLPVGFRYVPGTSRLEQAPTGDPNVSDTGTLLTFDLDLVEPGETIQLDYALQIGPGAVLGSAINEAVVRGPDGAPVSNTGRAAIRIREDLLRSTSTIIGRITEGSCDADSDWVRPIERGLGVEGVRLYMETGAYVVSDADGLYHFEGVREGTHVVQVDRETLPEGYALVACEENTRFAGSMQSQFVDVQGGGISRANFYLERTGDTGAAAADETAGPAADTALTEYKRFDRAWLDAQQAGVAWAYPDVSRTADIPSSNIGIQHGPTDTVELSVNGRAVPDYHITGRVASSVNDKALTRFKGVSLEDGRNVVVATVRAADGSVLQTLREDIHYVRTIARITALPEESVLIADGQTAPEIAIRFADEAGRPVHAGRFTTIEVEPPYAHFDENRDDMLAEEASEIVAPLSARRDLSVGRDGVLRVRLNPTLKTGKVTLHAVTDAGRRVPIYMNLAPEKRDWILVGLAEGSAALERVRGNSEALVANGSNPDEVPGEAIMQDGRVAFFAKGMIKGEWLMTLSLDTDKRKSRPGSRADGDFLGEIDPNAYYTLYGDRTYQEFEGQSRYPLFVKLEKAQGYALFGDYDTNVTEGRLTAYSRRLSGLKGEYFGENVQVLGFAAETNQGFALDEIAADGTSGIYQLSNSNILAQSEEIVLETRDRVRPDVVLERKVLARYLDYTLDYLTGELLFRLPVDATDADFNPVVIVADYETSEEVERNVTFGGRVQTQLADGRVQIGSTFVHEDGSAVAAGAESTQVGVDMLVAVNDTTQARLEYAITDTDNGGTADAKLLEIVHTSERVVGEAYFRQQDGGFGLGQRTSNTEEVRRYGARANVRLGQSDSAETGERTTRSLQTDVYREENLATGASRSSADVLLAQKGPRIGASVGLRAVSDSFEDRDDRESLLAVGQASYDLPSHDTSFQLTHEQPLGGKDEVSAQPARTSLQVSKRLLDRAVVTVRHDRTDGEFAQANTTTLGVDFTPWRGAQITASGDMVTQDSSRRLGATIGLDQQVRINDNWSLSAGLRDRTVRDAQEEFVQVAPDEAVSPFERNEDFTSAYLGVAYQGDTTTGSLRGETRQTEDQETYIASLSAARALSETLSLAGSARLVGTVDDIAGNSRRADVRLGTSYRPRDEDLVLFDRLDVSYEDRGDGVSQTKVVNNAAVNTWIDERWQLTANVGTKYTETDIAGQSLSNWSHLVGGETRFDVTERVDLGFRGQLMRSSSQNAVQYSYGPSVGVSPAKNVWISAGYNFEGFRDDDFEAAEYSRKGPWVTLRLKFDQDTADGLLRRISPRSMVEPKRTGTGG